jgi:hypothetical protein
MTIRDLFSVRSEVTWVEKQHRNILFLSELIHSISDDGSRLAAPQKFLLSDNLLWEIWGFSRRWLSRMASSGMLRRVARVRTDVSEELSTSILQVIYCCLIFRFSLYIRFEVFTAVTMKNAAFWDIKTQFVPHRRHITSPLRPTVG